MSKEHNNKGTLTQKAKRLFVKTTLTAIFLGAASTGVAAPSPEEGDTSKVCTSNNNLQHMAQAAPQLFRDLSLMEKLPITGRTVFDRIKDPANNMWSCLFSVPAGTSTPSSYNNRLANIARGDSSSTTFHEYFHATQDINGGDIAMTRLTMKDATIAQLLMEASAVAYELAARQEAENRGWAFFDPAPVTTTGPGFIMTRSKTSASTNSGTKAAFRAAYDDAWNQNAGLENEARMARALESGGKAVVRRLLENQDAEWTRLYVQLARENIGNNAPVFKNDGREKRAGYETARRKAYSVLGTVGKISFIPDEYMGPDAAKYIDKCFTEMGFRISALPPPRHMASKKPPFLG